MTTMMENVKTVNSSVRTVLMVGILGILGWGGYTGFNAYIKPGLEANQAKEEELLKLRQENEGNKAALAQSEKEKRELKDTNDRMQTSLKPVSYTHLTLPTIYSV